MRMTTKNEYIEQVIEFYSDEGKKRNGVKKIADKFNINVQTVYKWKTEGRIPHGTEDREYIKVISEETGIKRYNLNPIGYYPDD